MKKYLLKIEYCNSRCPNFYHNYEDNEKIYCVELDKKIDDDDMAADKYVDVFCDLRRRPIPSECPLEDA